MNAILTADLTIILTIFYNSDTFTDTFSDTFFSYFRRLNKIYHIMTDRQLLEAIFTSQVIILANQLKQHDIQNGGSGFNEVWNKVAIEMIKNESTPIYQLYSTL